MNIALWIAAGLLAVVSLGGGFMLLARSGDRLAASGMGWAADFGAAGLKSIGALKLLGAAGLVLPAALDIAPVLVPAAAAGWVLLMAGASVVHLRRREARVLGTPLILLALAAFIAWGRLGPEPFTG